MTMLQSNTSEEASIMPTPIKTKNQIKRDRGSDQIAGAWRILLWQVLNGEPDSKHIHQSKS